MKRIGYYIFNFFYYIFYLFPTNKNKLLLIMTHDTSPEGNVLYSFNYFKSKNPKLFYKKITKEDYNFKINNVFFKKILNFFIFIPYHVATSKIIFLDNIFLPFAYTKFKKDVYVVQLWHGTGSIKKFALDSEKGIIKKLAKKSTSKQTHLIVGSDEMIPIYKSAFGMSSKKIFPIGSPRTDIFFDKSIIDKKIKKFYALYPELINKKLILYAPTFRDKDYKKIYENNKENSFNAEFNQDIINILKYLDDSYVFLLKLHPHIANKFSFKNLNLERSIENRFYNFSNFKDVNTLLFVSSILITDYSSIIFEYSLLNKKMIFYPYDLEEFKKISRNFYFEYETFVPDLILYNPEDIADYIKKGVFTDYNEFNKKYMRYCDGYSTKRLYDIVLD